MTRSHKIGLSIMALILLSLVALLVLLLTNPLSPPIPAIEQTNTWVADFAATHASTIQAIGTAAMETATAP